MSRGEWNSQEYERSKHPNKHLSVRPFEEIVPRANTSLEERQRWMRERQAHEEFTADLREAGVFVFEPHFTPKQLGKMWGLDESTVRRMFQDEPGVLRIGKANRRDGKRDYVSLRIPESVAVRVHQERSR